MDASVADLDRDPVSCTDLGKGTQAGTVSGEGEGIAALQGGEGVQGEKAGSKLDKAQALGIPVLDEAAFMALIGKE